MASAKTHETWCTGMSRPPTHTVRPVSDRIPVGGRGTRRSVFVVATVLRGKVGSVSEQTCTADQHRSKSKRGKATRTFAPVPLPPSLTTLVAILLGRVELVAADPPPIDGLCSLQLRGKGAKVPLPPRPHVNLRLPRLIAQACVNLFEAAHVSGLPQEVDAPGIKVLKLRRCRRHPVGWEAKAAQQRPSCVHSIMGVGPASRASLLVCSRLRARLRMCMKSTKDPTFV